MIGLTDTITVSRLGTTVNNQGRPTGAPLTEVGTVLGAIRTKIARMYDSSTGVVEYRDQGFASIDPSSTHGVTIKTADHLTIVVDGEQQVWSVDGVAHTGITLRCALSKVAA